MTQKTPPLKVTAMTWVDLDSISLIWRHRMLLSSKVCCRVFGYKSAQVFAVRRNASILIPMVLQTSHSKVTDKNMFGKDTATKNTLILSKTEPVLTLILPRSRTGTVWFYTSTSNKRAARPKLYTKSLTGDLNLMYSRLTLVRISFNL